MDKKKSRAIGIAAAYIIFIVFTILVKTVNVKPVGPMESSVGFADINSSFHILTGVNLLWYEISEVFGVLAIAVCGIFGILGISQLIKRKSIKAVDRDILILGAFYAAVVACYAVFEVIVINYRPIITDEGLEVSYPSSHTMLIVCVMISAMMQIMKRVTNRTIGILLVAICLLITVLTVFGRLICGVHWLTDIVGAIFLSVALLYTYYSFVTDNVI